MYQSKSKLIQLIHIGKAHLKWDDELYRQVLTALTQKDSCKDMSQAQLERVLDHMKSKGFKPVAKGKGKYSPVTRDKDPEDKTPLDKLRQLWIAMRSRGYLRDGSEGALLAWSKAQAKRLNKNVAVERLEWLKPGMLHALIEQLKRWYKREMISELIDLVPQLRALPLNDHEQYQAKYAVYGYSNFNRCNVEQLESAISFITLIVGRYAEAGNG